MRYIVYIVDPFGGGITETSGAIVVTHKIIGQLGEIDVEIPVIRKPGELRVTVPCINHLGKDAVLQCFVDHLLGKWWTVNRHDAHALDDANEKNDVLYNLDVRRGIYLITYPGDNSTLITREEY